MYRFDWRTFSSPLAAGLLSPERKRITKFCNLIIPAVGLKVSLSFNTMEDHQPPRRRVVAGYPALWGRRSIAPEKENKAVGDVGHVTGSAHGRHIQPGMIGTLDKPTQIVQVLFILEFGISGRVGGTLKKLISINRT